MTAVADDDDAGWLEEISGKAEDWVAAMTGVGDICGGISWVALGADSIGAASDGASTQGGVLESMSGRAPAD